MRFFKPLTPKCYKCSMPGPYSCELPGCGLPMCIKHVKHKAGGTLCAKHLETASIIQDNAKPSLKFPDRGVAKAFTALELDISETPEIKSPTDS